MIILLDTSALLYYTLAPNRLSEVAKNAIAQAEKLLISSISLWEIALKAKKGKLTLPMSIETFVEELDTIEIIDILDVSVSVWLENVRLDWEHRDPADRTIVATAVLHNCSLVTSDQEIRAFYTQSIW